MKRVVIAGIGHTPFGKLPGVSTTAMNVEATRAAITDAGISKSEIDALFVKVPTSQYTGMYGQVVAEAMGLQPRVGGVWDQGGATNISMISFAAMAIQSGQCEVAVVTISDNPRTGTRQAYSKAWGDNAIFGWLSVAAGYAMVAQRHLQQLGTPNEALGWLAIAARKHGANNPHAQLQKPLTMDEYLDAPYLVEPLRRDDCCLVSDGGAAVVLMSETRANELNASEPVAILGYGQGQTSWDVPLRPDLTSTMQKKSAETAFSMAGLKPADVDVAQLYDCFTITPLMTLEDYGFCRPGESHRFVADGNIEIGGVLPLNTSGGLLSETGMPGMQLVLEGVRQIRGTSVNQVKDAKVSLVSNQGGVMHTHSTLILGQS